jgi:L-threonylcarbamoyladenylate synthase
MTKSTGARIYRGTPQNLAMLANKLREGQIVAVPTETVYGLAGNALDSIACRRIFKAKGRPTNDPLIVHIHSFDQLPEIADSNPIALKLAETYWPGPLTLILPKKPVISGLITAGLDSVAVRMPHHRLLRELLKKCGLPLAIPSANLFGYISPTTAEHVRLGLQRKIHYILDGGPAAIGLESTILDVRDPEKIRLLRHGSITPAQIQTKLGLVVRASRPGSTSKVQKQLAPGLLKRHYSPRTQLILHEKLSQNSANSATTDEAFLFFTKPKKPLSAHIYWLDEIGDQENAARQLFSKLRDLDAKGYRIINAEKAPTGAMSAAINDRLNRAAARD